MPQQAHEARVEARAGDERVERDGLARRPQGHVEEERGQLSAAGRRHDLVVGSPGRQGLGQEVTQVVGGRIVGLVRDASEQLVDTIRHAAAPWRSFVRPLPPRPSPSPPPPPSPRTFMSTERAKIAKRRHKRGTGAWGAGQDQRVTYLSDRRPTRTCWPGCGRTSARCGPISTMPGRRSRPRLCWRRMAAHLELEAEVGGYEAESLVADELAGLPGWLAPLLGVDADEVMVTETRLRPRRCCCGPSRKRSDTRAATACWSTSSRMPPPTRRCIACSGPAARRSSRCLHGRDGTVDPGALAAAVDERVKLVLITHMPTHVGHAH